MKFYTDDEIKKLIEMPKRITVRPQRQMQLSNGHFRNNMKLESTDGQSNFSVFMRKNEAFHENFSIGLVYHPKDDPKEVHLLRCNGPHGPHESFSRHEACHIHIAKDTNIKEGLKEDREAYVTEEYSTFEDSLIFFLKKCNIIDADKYFELEWQPSLF
ncbi:MAG: hypothetical protein PVH61_42760 [Candidatus Aminicenantes bacterium]|jgi:hypothetical protein